MFALLVLVFLVVPIVELAVIVQVAGAIGVLETIGLLVLVSVVGAWLVKREGIGIVRRLRSQLDRGQLPERDLIDGFLVMVAGALLITPGFCSDVFALVLLVPPSRAVLRGAVQRSFRRRTVAFRFVTTSGRGGGVRGVHDVGGTDTTELGRP